ncbi:MAG: fimbrillin family protein [Mucinivorans sp.]
MRKYTSLIALAVVVMTLGCKKSIVAPIVKPEAVRFSLVTAAPSVVKNSSDQKSISRAVTPHDEFMDHCMIGIFATKAAISDLSEITNSNVGYSNAAGSSVWSVVISGEPITYLPDDAPMNFYAYHPYTGQKGTSVTIDKTTLKYTLPVDQSSDKQLKDADLMWGNSLNKKQSDGTVNLEFSHKLSKLTLKIKKGTDWNNEAVLISKIAISGSNILSFANLDLASGSLTPQANADQSTNTVTANLGDPQRLDQNNDVVCEFILIPSSAYGTQIDFTVGDGSKTFKGTINSALTFKSGTQLNLGVTINKTKPIDLYIDPTIVPWNFVSQIDIEGI